MKLVEPLTDELKEIHRCCRDCIHHDRALERRTTCRISGIEIRGSDKACENFYAYTRYLRN